MLADLPRAGFTIRKYLTFHGSIVSNVSNVCTNIETREKKLAGSVFRVFCCIAWRGLIGSLRVSDVGNRVESKRCIKFPPIFLPLAPWSIIKISKEILYLDTREFSNYSQSIICETISQFFSWTMSRPEGRLNYFYMYFFEYFLLR